MTQLEPGAEALWVLQHLVPDRGVSNVAVAIEMYREVRWWPLQEAVNWLVDRHRALRTACPSVDGVPALVVRDAVELEVDVFGSDGQCVEADLREFAARAFDLESAPLLRVGLFTVSPVRQVICLVAHHIVVDAASLGRLVAELGEAYESLLAAGVVPETALPESAPPAAPDKAALAYWREHVAGFDVAGMRLEEARPVGMNPAFSGEVVERVLSTNVDAALVALRKTCRATDAIVLLAAYFVTLRGHGAAADALVGVMTDTRRGTDAVGYHVATLPVRLRADDDVTFAQLTARVVEGMVAGLDRGAVPFEVLAPEHTVDTDDPAWWRSRLVRHLFNFRPGQRSYQPVGDDSLFRDVSTGFSRFDLELTAERVAEGLVVKLLHSTEVHDTPFAQRFLDRLELVLRQAAENPARAVADFDLRSAEDLRIVAAANDTARPAPLTVPAMVRSADDDAIAVVDGGRRTTYRNLRAAAWSVRHEVARLVGTDGAVVAVAAPRSAGTAAAVLGIWAAGASYLPLDPDHPADRLAHQLDEVGCELIIGGGLPESCTAGRICVPVPDPSSSIGGSEPLPAPEPDGIAYVIFTSGSTGRPKGVRISHRNLANVVSHFARDLDLGADDGVLWLTTFAFDISVLELFLPLAVGSSLVVAPDAARARPDLLLDLVERESVRVVQATPTTWRLVAPAAAGRLAGRVVLCGGEPLTSALAQQLLATGAAVRNVYGPTETTIWSTSAVLTDPDAPVTVGLPITNTVVDVLDEHGRPRPVGLAGELCVGGLGVAVDYHGRPELTGERFRTGSGLGRYYRTGDRARWRPDGALDVLGREDRQIKLRGHRVELGEVESVVQAHIEVSAAVVVPHGDLSGDGGLVAFVVAQRRPGLGNALWQHVSKTLPGYSVPARFVVLDGLPLTANGKVDNSALAELAARHEDASAWVVRDAEPADEVETALIELWRDLLGRPSLGHDSNFFLSGGTSLLAVRLAQQASARCGAPVSMGMVFRAPTPVAMAALLRAGGRS